MLSETQKQMRYGRITSSVIADVLGLSPWGDEHSAYKKIMRLSTFKGSKATERGDLLEQVTLEYVPRVFEGMTAELHPPFKRIEDSGCLVGAGHPWAGDSIDAIYKHDGAIFGGEGKTVAAGSASKWGEPGTSQVPPYVRVQCLWHLLHWPEADRIYVPVLFGGHQFQFELFHVDRHQAAIDEIAEQAFEWWRKHIEERVVPPAGLDGEGAEQATPAKDIAQPSEDFYALVDEYLALDEQCSEYKKRRGELRSKIEGSLQGPADITMPQCFVKFQPWGSGIKVDWKSIVRDMHVSDEVIEKHTKKTEPPMRLTIKKRESQ